MTSQERDEAIDYCKWKRFYVYPAEKKYFDRAIEALKEIDTTESEE